MVELTSEHDRISLLICKQLTGSITPEEQTELDEWRKSSTYNEAVYQRLTDYDKLLVEHHRARLFDYRRPLAATEQRLGLNQVEQQRRPSWWRYAAAAAVALLLLAGGYVAINNISQPDMGELIAEADENAPHPGTTVATLTMADGKQVELGSNDAFNTRVIASARHESRGSKSGSRKQQVLTTPRGGEFRIVLEDGSEVWLNAQSRLIYPETFDREERRVELEGEAYFKVKKDAAKPFIVVSGQQQVRVYGTEFNVTAYSDEGIIYTTLVEGSISLRPVDGRHGELMLTPGKQAVFDKGDASATIRSVDVDMAISWRNGSFMFENQTMGEIMRTLSRWYDFEYEFLDEQAASTVFMGSIPRYGSFNEVTEIFHSLGGVRLTQQGRKVTIRSTHNKK